MRNSQRTLKNFDFLLGGSLRLSKLNTRGSLLQCSGRGQSEKYSQHSFLHMKNNFAFPGSQAIAGGVERTVILGPSTSKFLRTSHVYLYGFPLDLLRFPLLLVLLSDRRMQLHISNATTGGHWPKCPREFCPSRARLWSSTRWWLRRPFRRILRCAEVFADRVSGGSGCGCWLESIWFSNVTAANS